MKVKSVVFSLTAAALTSCASVSYKVVDFDVLRPADYTMPSWADTVLIVDNASTPECVDSTMPYDYITNIVSPNTARLVGQYVAHALTKDFKQSGYMVMREAGDRYINLTSGRIDSLLSGHPSTVILSLDDISCKSVLRMAGKEYDEESGEMLSCIDIVGETKTQMSLITAPFVKQRLSERTDTIIFRSCDTSIAYIATHYPSLVSRYQQQGTDVGHKYAEALLPSWERVYRSLYVTTTQDMVAAATWVEQGDWDEAKNLWTRAATEAKKKPERVRASLNMALAYEREDNPAAASMWCSKALDIIESCDSKTAAALSSEKKRAESMFSYLMQRITEKNDLDKQMN